MTHEKSTAGRATLKALLAEDQDLMRHLVREVMQEILEAEMTDALDAAPGERTEARLGYRAGHYPRTLITRVGKLELRVPRDRNGRFSTLACLFMLQSSKGWSLQQTRCGSDTR